MTAAKKTTKAKATSEIVASVSSDDAFTVIAASSSSVTKAMEVKSVGCFLQVVTVAGIAVTFAPGVKLFTDGDNKTHIVAL